MSKDDIEHTNVQPEDIEPPLSLRQLAEQAAKERGQRAAADPKDIAAAQATSWDTSHPHDSNRQVALRTALALASTYGNSETPVSTAAVLASAAKIEAWLATGALPPADSAAPS